eukprot:sb/3460478/
MVRPSTFPKCMTGKENLTNDREKFVKEFTESDNPDDEFLHCYLRSAILQWMDGSDPYETLAAEVTDTLRFVLCAGKDPSVVLPELQEIASAGGPCGRVMNFGDPTFRCVECAIDSTCVMCMACYNNSIHKREGHTLLVHTSPGTGMCDCGDEEAWKYGSTCSIHESTEEEKDDIELKLPEKIRNIAKCIFTEILHLAWMVYIDQDVDSHESVFDIPKSLMPTSEHGVTDRFSTVILNDEYHNFDEVIKQFKTLLDCSHTEASAMATGIDREGRMKIKEAGRVECMELTNRFLNYKPSRNTDKKPLMARTMQTFSYYLQEVLVDVIKLLSDLAVNPGFRRIICNVGLGSVTQGTTQIEGILLSESYLWKKIKCAWHSLFMGTYLVDPVHKKDFAVILIKNYESIIGAYVHDERGREATYSVVSLTVQLFTVPSIAHMLLLEHSAAEVIYSEFVKFYGRFVSVGKDGRERLTSITNINKTRERIMAIMTDIKFILSNVPETVTPAIEAAFLRFFKLFVRFLGWLQEMNPHKRESSNHIARDREWDIYFMLEISDLNLITMTVARWCVSTPTLQRACLDTLLESMMKGDVCLKTSDPCPVNTAPAIAEMVAHLSSSEDTSQWKVAHKSKSTLQMFPLNIRYVDHHVLYSPVSFHLPICRFMGMVVSYVSKLQPHIVDLNEVYGEFSCQELLDLPLRPIILSQQIEANLWKRNGTTMDNQASCYREHYKSIMWDKDLVFLQNLMAACQPNEALIRIIHKANVSEASDYDIIRKDALHILATARLPRSKVMRSLEMNFTSLKEERITRTPKMEEMFEEIAVKVKEDGVKISMSLKPALYKELNPFYYHFAHGQRQKVEGVYYAWFGKRKNFIPPPMPPFVTAMSGLRQYFTSPVLQRFMYVVLLRFTLESPMVSDLLVHQVVHIIMNGLHDEQVGPTPLYPKFSEVISATGNPYYLIFDGVETAVNNQQSILSLIQTLLISSAKAIVEIKPILRWIVHTSGVLTNEIPAEEGKGQDTGSDKVDDKAAKAAARRRNIMGKFKMDQAAFFTDNQGVFETMEVEEGEDQEEGMVVECEERVACGAKKGPLPQQENTTLQCILCHDSEKVTEETTLMYGCLVEKSVVFKPQKSDNLPGDMGELLGGENLHIQSCGHPIHMRCLQSIIRTTPNPLVRQILTLAGDSLIHPIHNKCFVCPYCKMISNTVVPVVALKKEPADMSTEEFLQVVNDPDQDDVMATETEPDESERVIEDSGIPDVLETIEHHRGAMFPEFDGGIIGVQNWSDAITYPVRFNMDITRFFEKVRMTLNTPKKETPTLVYALKMIAYTFSAMEYNIRGKPLLAGLASYQESFWETFLWTFPLSMQNGVHCNKLKSEMLSLFRPSPTLSLLNMDVFTVFVAAKFLLTTPGKGNNGALVELSVLAETLKILMSVKPSSLAPETGAGGTLAIEVAGVWGYIRKVSGMSDVDDPYPSPTYLLSQLKKRLLPFLRKMSLFLRYSTCITGPATLCELQSPEGEFDLMIAYLGIGSLSSLLQISGTLKSSLVHGWLGALNQDDFWQAAGRSVREGKLAELPESFIDLLVRGSTYCCPKGKNKFLAVCLVCGEMVCYQSYCCSEDINGQTSGPCNVHAYRCSGSLGVFLTLDKCQVLLLPLGTQGMHLSGPYVDKYGESFKTSRNKALTLSETLYKKIEQMWVKHEIRPLVARSGDYEYGRINNMAHTGPKARCESRQTRNMSIDHLSSVHCRAVGQYPATFSVRSDRVGAAKPVLVPKQISDTATDPPPTTLTLGNVVGKLAGLSESLLQMGVAFDNVISQEERELGETAENISYLNRIFGIIREMNARSRVGTVCLPRSVPQKGSRMKGPSEVPISRAHVRSRIDFSMLDSIGHGIKESEQVQDYRPISSRKELSDYFNTLRLRKKEETYSKGDVMFRTERQLRERSKSVANIADMFKGRDTLRHRRMSAVAESSALQQSFSIDTIAIRGNTYSLSQPPQQQQPPSSGYRGGYRAAIPQEWREEDEGMDEEKDGSSEDESSSSSSDPQHIDVVRAAWPYLARQSDELTLGYLELVYVYYKNEDGWWEGRCGAQWGLFPGIYTMNSGNEGSVLGEALSALLQFRQISDTATDPPPTTLTLGNVVGKLAGLSESLLQMGVAFDNVISQEERELGETAENISYLNRIFGIIREMNARSRVGTVCLPRSVPQKGSRMKGPSEVPISRAHVRSRIDFSMLDSIGHGIKESEQVQDYRPISSRKELSDYFNTLRLRKKEETYSKGDVMFRTERQLRERSKSVANIADMFKGRDTLRHRRMSAVAESSALQESFSIDTIAIRGNTYSLSQPPQQVGQEWREEDEGMDEEKDGSSEDESSSSSSDPQHIDVVRAAWPYLARQSDELTLGYLELVYVYYKNEDGWWEGRCGAQWGLFPGIYTMGERERQREREKGRERER